jgi:hypothetical protein
MAMTTSESAYALPAIATTAANNSAYLRIVPLCPNQFGLSIRRANPESILDAPASHVASEE